MPRRRSFLEQSEKHILKDDVSLSKSYAFNRQKLIFHNTKQAPAHSFYGKKCRQHEEQNATEQRKIPN